MAAAIIAVDVMRSHGARNKTRLLELLKHYARVYGEDEADQFSYALDLAKRTVFDFDAES